MLNGFENHLDKGQFRFEQVRKKGDPLWGGTVHFLTHADCQQAMVSLSNFGFAVLVFRVTKLITRDLAPKANVLRCPTPQWVGLCFPWGWHFPCGGWHFPCTGTFHGGWHFPWGGGFDFGPYLVDGQQGGWHPWRGQLNQRSCCSRNHWSSNTTCEVKRCWKKLLLLFSKEHETNLKERRKAKRRESWHRPTIGLIPGRVKEVIE